jgi:hypothetical protein
MDKPKEVTIQTYQGWEEFSNIEKGDKLDFFIRNGRMLDILFSQQFDRSFLDDMCILATQIRRMALTKMGAQKLSNLLSHKRAMLYFVQPSTRTFISFLNACHILGMKISEIRGTTTSSEVKGESQEDTIRTFASYVDLIIIRHPEEGFAEKTAWILRSRSAPHPGAAGYLHIGAIFSKYRRSGRQKNCHGGGFKARTNGALTELSDEKLQGYQVVFCLTGNISDARRHQKLLKKT